MKSNQITNIQHATMKSNPCIFRILNYHSPAKSQSKVHSPSGGAASTELAKFPVHIRVCGGAFKR